MSSNGDNSQARLSARELAVCERVARGLQDKQIAGELGLHESSVGTYLSRIFLKTRVRSRASLVTWLYENRVLALTTPARRRA